MARKGIPMPKDDGTLVGTTPQAAELLELLHLNYRTLRQRRQLLIAALRVFRQREPGLYEQWMGFPDGLPDLSRLRPPGGNSRPEGLAQSHLARRQRGSAKRRFSPFESSPPARRTRTRNTAFFRHSAVRHLTTSISVSTSLATSNALRSQRVR